MTTIVSFDTLYKFDTKGKLRIWYMQQDGSRYRTISGLKDGGLITSEWTQAQATNVGRANERDPVAQAAFEVDAEYKHNLARDYHRTVEEAQSGAHYFEPMLAHKYERFAPGFGQPKLDGVRCIAKAPGLFSREGKPILGAPHIHEALKPHFDANPSLIFDGELYNHDLKDDFNTIISVVKKKTPSEKDLEKSRALAQYHVYDLPSLQESFHARWELLKWLTQGMEPYGIHAVETRIVTSEDEYNEFHGMWLQAGYEGSIWRADALYEQKRSKKLLKRKEFVDAEYPISRIIEGEGNWTGMAKAVEFILPGDLRTESGERPKAGIKGSQAFARDLLRNADQYKQATIKYFALTPGGIPRFPVATQFHGEKREL